MSTFLCSLSNTLLTLDSPSILVFKNGEIVERGNHKELLELNGVFAAMWAEQIHAAEAEAEAEPKKEAE